MKPIVKRVLVGLGALVGVAAVGAGSYVAVQTSAFDASIEKVYEVPVPTIARSTDPAVLARGKHIAESVGACATRDCHGADLGGGRPVDVGPIGTLAGPNITTASLGAAYTDGELARLIKHGIKKDGRSLRFMPAQDFTWLPMSDVVAVISYIRSVPPVDRPNGSTVIKPLGKVLDRRDQMILDVARRIDHSKDEQAPPPTASAEYGRYIGRLCEGCHGPHLSGGPIPGAPSSIPIPSNITAHESGIKDWTYDDFDKLLQAGVRKNGKQLDPFMPVEAFGKLDEVEKKALWSHLRAAQPLAYGNR